MRKKVIIRIKKFLILEHLLIEQKYMNSKKVEHTKKTTSSNFKCFKPIRTRMYGKKILIIEILIIEMFIKYPQPPNQCLL